MCSSVCGLRCFKFGPVFRVCVLSLWMCECLIFVLSRLYAESRWEFFTFLFGEKRTGKQITWYSLHIACSYQVLDTLGKGWVPSLEFCFVFSVDCLWRRMRQRSRVYFSHFSLSSKVRGFWGLSLWPIFVLFLFLICHHPRYFFPLVYCIFFIFVFSI